MADQTDNKADSSFEPTEKLESFFIGLIQFVQQFLVTLRDLAFKQTEFSSHLKSHDNDKYTKPVTFITIISFLAIRIFRFGALTILLMLSTTSCETQTEVNYPSLLDELRVPSVTEVILYGIPVLIVVLLLSQALKSLLLKSSHESQSVLVSIAYYTVGFQFIGFLFIFVLISIMSFSFNIVLEDDVIFYLLLLILIWVAVLFYRLVVKTIDKKDFRVSTIGFKQLWLLLWSFVLMAGTTTFVGYLAYTLAQVDFQELKPKPLISVNLISYDTADDETFSVTLLVRNNSDEEIVLLPSDVTIFGEIEHQGRIVRSGLGQPPVVIIKSNEIEWLTIEFEKNGVEYGMSPLKNFISFATLSGSGDDGRIRGYIYSNGDQVDISMFE